jgi:hypothetical protein
MHAAKLESTNEISFQNMTMNATEKSEEKSTKNGNARLVV